MAFWITIAATAALIALFLGRAVLRGAEREIAETSDFDLQVYRDQLQEVERDVARGVVSEGDAERIRTEISRRILSMDAQKQAEVAEGSGPVRALVLLATVFLIGGSVALYAWMGQPGYGDLALQDRIAFAEELRDNRPSQATAVSNLPPAPELEGVTEDFRKLMEQLRQTVANRPDDLQGHLLLAQNEARLGNFSAAAEAQEKVLRLQGDAATPKDIADYAELLVLAAGGYVSPEAETAFRAALAEDQDDGRSRYYVGLTMAQTGRPDIAFRIWDALLRRGPADAAWIDPILAQIEDAAYLAGVNYEIPTIGPGDAPGPTAEDIEAAAEMSVAERMDMIGAMVDGLSNRLATEGGPPQDWARLITSLAVLGNPQQALAVFDNAMEVFDGNPGAIDIIRDAGQQAGVAE